MLSSQLVHSQLEEKIKKQTKQPDAAFGKIKIEESAQG